MRPGERIALDGTVLSGASAIDESAITGESVPAEKAPGDEVFAGTLNESGLLHVEATALSTDSTLARVVHMVEEAQASRAPSQSLIDRFTRWYTPAVIVLAAVVAVVPPLLGAATGADLGSWAEWVNRSLVLLVVSCPCALVISTPVSIVSGITRASRDGVLVKGGAFLEAAAAIDAIAFDKTGTLTHGRPRLIDIASFGSLAENRALEVAAALESHSNHPIARAIVRASDSAELPEVSGFTERARHRGERCHQRRPVGAIESYEGGTRSPQTPTSACAPPWRPPRPPDARPWCCWKKGWLWPCLSVADTVRPESGSVVRSLRALGVEHLVMLTGDNERVAETVAGEIGLTSYVARLLPQAKTDAVRALKTRFRTVAMVGDGVNDAPALAAADLEHRDGGRGQ